LKAHFDDHCIWVLQLAGCKRWLLRAPSTATTDICNTSATPLKSESNAGSISRQPPTPQCLVLPLAYQPGSRTVPDVRE
jgi:hypothetical protein